VQVTLTRSEQRIATWLAHQRASINRKRGITDAKVGPQDSLQIDIDGLLGEFAFAKLFNLYPDLQVGSRPLHDVMTAIGGIDVKTTRYRSGKLLATRKKSAIRSDWYALMWLESEATLYFRGVARADVLLDQSNLKPFGGTMSYWLEQRDLIQPEDFALLLPK
jgi:hypothetical protein